MRAQKDRVRVSEAPVLLVWPIGRARDGVDTIAASPFTQRMPRSRTPGPAKMTRPPLERMNYIHEQRETGKLPNCSSIAKKFEVTPKTIQRDIEFMRDRMG